MLDNQLGTHQNMFCNCCMKVHYFSPPFNTILESNILSIQIADIRENTMTITILPSFPKPGINAGNNEPNPRASVVSPNAKPGLSLKTDKNIP